ncbi:hypothetical protein [Rhodopirellula baltica]
MTAVLREGLEYVLSPSSPPGKDDRSSSHDLGEPFFKTPNSFIDIDDTERRWSPFSKWLIRSPPPGYRYRYQQY